jgi:hypothetical protein
MNPNYPSASQVVRNLADIKSAYETLAEFGRFRIVRFETPFFGGSEFWIVNERGFLWEACDSEAAALEYLESDEAKEYQLED